jgi:hypothetical protein
MCDMPRRKIIVEETVSSLPPKRKRPAAFLAVLVVLCIAITAGAIFVGTSDKGQINVSGVIQSSNQERIDAGQEPLDAVSPNDAFKNMPNGGLVANESQPAQTPPPEAVDPNATATATSTEEGTPSDTEDTSINTQTDTASEGDESASDTSGSVTQ